MKKRIDWMSIGKEHWEGKQDAIQGYCETIEWQALPCSMSFSGGLAVKQIIKEQRIPKVSHVAESHHMAPCGLLGIRAHYKNSDVEIFAVDEGVCLTPLCIFVSEENHGA
jgi:hypothetical protein